MGKKREEYMKFEVKLKRYWTNKSKVTENPQQDL